MNHAQSERSLPPDYITSKKFFMGIAYLASKRSKDPNKRVGACIVNEENNIVEIGYNSMPNGCKTLPWNCQEKKFYVTLYPCSECAKFIIQKGIKTVIYTSNVKADHEKTKASEKLLKKAKIDICEFKLDHNRNSKLKIDLYGDPYTPSTNVPELATSNQRDEDGNGSITN